MAPSTVAGANWNICMRHFAFAHLVTPAAPGCKPTVPLKLAKRAVKLHFTHRTCPDKFRGGRVWRRPRGRGCEAECRRRSRADGVVVRRVACWSDAHSPSAEQRSRLQSARHAWHACALLWAVRTPAKIASVRQADWQAREFPPTRPSKSARKRNSWQEKTKQNKKRCVVWRRFVGAILTSVVRGLWKNCVCVVDGPGSRSCKPIFRRQFRAIDPLRRSRIEAARIVRSFVSSCGSPPRAGRLAREAPRAPPIAALLSALAARNTDRSLTVRDTKTRERRRDVTRLEPSVSACRLWLVTAGEWRSSALCPSAVSPMSGARATEPSTTSHVAHVSPPPR